MTLGMTSSRGNARDKFGRDKVGSYAHNQAPMWHGLMIAQGRCTISGSLAKFAAMRRASSRVSRSPAAPERNGLQ